MTYPLLNPAKLPTLPVAFTSRFRNSAHKGCILANEEFFVVFESHPLVLNQLLQLMNTNRLDPIPIEYLYVASVFYRKSRDPFKKTQRFPILCPICSFCLEYTKSTCAMKPQSLMDKLAAKKEEPAEIFSTRFQENSHVNMGKIPNDFTDESALEHLMEGICNQLDIPRNDFKEIGPLSLGPNCPEIA